MNKSQSGFTLIELMIAMAMAAIIVGIIYSAYNVQTKIYTEQDKAAEMQQNIRAGIAFLQREARMAGYNPTDAKHASCSRPSLAPTKVVPGVHTASATSFGFSMDLNGDGDCIDTGENVTYAIYTEAGIQKLGRSTRKTDDGDLSAPVSVAENITNIDFFYIFSSVPSITPKQSPASGEIDDIASVQVSLLARASTPDRKAARTTSFTVPKPDASGAPTAAGGTVWGPFTDSISRRLLTTTINCRNMGLK